MRDIALQGSDQLIIATLLSTAIAIITGASRDAKSSNKPLQSKVVTQQQLVAVANDAVLQCARGHPVW